MSIDPVLREPLNKTLRTKVNSLLPDKTQWSETKTSKHTHTHPPADELRPRGV